MPTIKGVIWFDMGFLEVDLSTSLVVISFLPIELAMGIWLAAKLHSFLSCVQGVCSRIWPSFFFKSFCGIYFYSYLL